MKKFLFIIFSVFLFSCMETRYMTEQYIKTEIEKHKVNDFSSIKLYSIYQSGIVNGTYLEFTGYKYKSEKGLVIAADRYYLARQRFRGDITRFAEVTYIQLNSEQCQAILDNYETLEEKIGKSNPASNEEVYQDFT